MSDDLDFDLQDDPFAGLLSRKAKPNPALDVEDAPPAPLTPPQGAPALPKRGYVPVGEVPALLNAQVPTRIRDLTRANAATRGMKMGEYVEMLIEQRSVSAPTQAAPAPAPDGYVDAGEVPVPLAVRTTVRVRDLAKRKAAAAGMTQAAYIAALVEADSR